MSQEDWKPTLLAAAGVSDVKEKLTSKEGYKANGKDFRVHLDGYNFLPYFQGKAEKGPRREILYFTREGLFNAIRVDDWKLSIAIEDGDISQAFRKTPAWAVITNLRADPFEHAYDGSAMYLKWYTDNMWLGGFVQPFVQDFFGSLADYPIQMGSPVSIGNIGYHTIDMLKDKAALKKLMDEDIAN